MAEQQQQQQYYVKLPSRIPEDFVSHYYSAPSSSSSAAELSNKYYNNANNFTLFPPINSTFTTVTSAMLFPGAGDEQAGTLPAATGSVTYMAAWEAVIALVLMIIVALSAGFGNILVAVSVFTYPPLKTCQNYLIASLAVADVLVSVLVMPFQILYALYGEWQFGLALCIFNLTMDICLCTASILNLVGIALDRYWAIHDPINYSQKRTAKRVICMIGIIWVLSFIISSPPLLGWNDWSKMEATACNYTQELGYIVYSSFGSFFIPLIMLLTIYFRIFVATRARLRRRAQAHKILTQTNNAPINVSNQPSHVPAAVTNNKHESSEDNFNNNNSPSCMETTNNTNANNTITMATSLYNLQTTTAVSSSSQGSGGGATATVLRPTMTAANAKSTEVVENDVDDDYEADDDNNVFPKNINIKQSTRELLKKSCAEIAAAAAGTTNNNTNTTSSSLHQQTRAPLSNSNTMTSYRTAPLTSTTSSCGSHDPTRDPLLAAHHSLALLPSPHGVNNETTQINSSNSNTTTTSTSADMHTVVGAGAKKSSNNKNKKPPPLLNVNNNNNAATSLSLHHVNMTPPTPRIIKKSNGTFAVVTTSAIETPPPMTPKSIIHFGHQNSGSSIGGASVQHHPNKKQPPPGGHTEQQLQQQPPLRPENNFVANALKERQKISLTKERKAARTLLMIVAGFTACWLPFFLCYVIVPFCPQCGEPPPRLWMFVLWLGYCNSAINPFIYTTSVDFRRGFARVLSRYFGTICPCFKKLDDGSRR